MKIYFSFALVFAASLIAKGQGTFFYDQQSATNGIAAGRVSINGPQPLGQAFTPSLPAVGLVQFQVSNDFTPTNATLAVNLWADSLGGTLLGTTQQLPLPANYWSFSTTFLFANPVAVTPGSTYYFEPVILSGGNNDWFFGADYYSSAGGALVLFGWPQTNGLAAWFREGIIVPEPSAIVILGLGLGVLVFARRVHNKRSPFP